MNETTIPNNRFHQIAVIISFLLSLCLFSLSNEASHVLAASDNSLSVISIPTAYTPTGGYTDIAISVRNNTLSDVTGISIIDKTYITDDDGDEWSPYEFQHSTRTGVDSCPAPVNATKDELGYTIKGGQTATFYIRVYNKSYRPVGEYTDYIKLGRMRREIASDYNPSTGYYDYYYKTIIEAEYTDRIPVTNAVYNPANAKLTIGTDDDGGYTVTPIGSVIDFGTIDLANADDKKLNRSKHLNIRNTSPVGNDEHDNPANITVSMDLTYDPDFDNYCFSFDDELMNGMHWSPLPPATETSYSSVTGKIILDATHMIAGTYITDLEINTSPFAAKINDNATNNNGKHTIPVKVVLTGKNNRLPARPSNFKASPGNNQVQLTWTAPKDGLTYTVYRREGKEDSLNPDNWTSANWSSYTAISGPDITAKEDGTFIYVDGTAENGKTYSYVVSTGEPFRGYASAPVSSTPKSTYVSRLLSPENVYADDSIGGVQLEWQMNELYGGKSNNGQSMVDHFNIYRDGVLVAQINQNAVEDTPETDWIDDGNGGGDYGIARHKYEWSTFVETPELSVPYQFAVSAVSKSGLEGYLSEEVSGCGLFEAPQIISHNSYYDSYYHYDDSTGIYKPAISVKAIISSDGDITGRITVWRSEGLSAPDVNATPYMTTEETFDDTNIVAGKTYTYTLRATDIFGNDGNYYTFTALAIDNVDTSSADVTWKVLEGRRAHMEWSGDYYYDYDNDKSVYPSTYKVYRNNVLVSTYSGKNDYIYEDTPVSDGAYVYRVDKIANGLTVKGRDFTFTRNTQIVDESDFLKAPEAPTLNVRISNNRPVLTWTPSSTGGKASGYHIYRKDAGEYAWGSRMVQEASWLSPYEKYWGNSRYLTINDSSERSFVDGESYNYKNDSYKGMLFSVDWTEQDCPHEYWITAFNNVGESKPSKVFTFDYAGTDEDGNTMVPVNDNDIEVPGKPVITKAWVEWDDHSKEDPDLCWDSMIRGNIHIAWKDSDNGGNIDSWKIGFDGVSAFNENGNYEIVYYKDVVNDPSIKTGNVIYGLSSLDATYGEYGDYGKTIKTKVTAVNSVGENESDEVDVSIYSLPRSRAFAENGSVKFEWTDLLNDDTTVVDSWKLLRKREHDSWETIKTFPAGEIDYYATDDNGVKSYMYRDSDVTNGWEYEYRIIAVCADKIDRPGSVIAVTPTRSATTEKPGTPSSLIAKVVDGGIILNWKAPALGGEPYEYQIEKETYWGSDTEKIWLYEGAATAPSTVYFYSPEKAGEYKLRVCATNTLNSKELKSDYSNEVTVTITQEQLYGQATERPAKPLVNATSEDGKITLKWTYDKEDGAVPSYYVIDRADAANTSPIVIAVVSGDGTSFTFTDDTVKPNVEYQYFITSCNSYSTSKVSVFVRSSGQSKDDIVAAGVNAKIEELPSPDTVTPSDSNKINEVKSIYDNLSDKQKKLISKENVDKLNKCINKLEYDELIALYGDVVKPVQDIIDALKESDKITLADEKQVKAARDAYDAITPATAKKIVDTTKLVEGELAVRNLKYNINTHGSISFTGSWVIGEEERPVVTVCMYDDELSSDNYSIGYVKEGTGVVQSYVFSSGKYKIVATGKNPYYGRLISKDYLTVYDVNDNTTDPDNTDADPKKTDTDTGKTGDLPDQNNPGGTQEKQPTDVKPATPGNDNKGLGENGTTVGKGADASIAETAITTATSDEGPKGSTFAPLMFRSTKQTKNSVKCTWKKTNGAKSYIIYGNLSGKKNKPVRIGMTTGSSFTVKQINGKKLKKGTYYKFILVALDGNNKVCSTSKTIYVATSGGKSGNYKKLTTKAVKDKVTIKRSKTFKLKANAVSSSKKLKVKKSRALSYESGNVKIATVNNKGVIKAIGKGSCYVYVYAQNGLYKKIKVTVK